MAKFGGDNWRGNVGVRVVRTDQTSKGNVVGTGGARIDQQCFRQLPRR